MQQHYCQRQKFFKTIYVELAKLKPAVLVGIPKAGDIYISLDGNVEELGTEGYSLSIKDYVAIHAAQYKGAFWGTRSILQILEQDAKVVRYQREFQEIILNTRCVVLCWM